MLYLQWHIVGWVWLTSVVCWPLLWTPHWLPIALDVLQLSAYRGFICWHWPLLLCLLGFSFPAHTLIVYIKLVPVEKKKEVCFKMRPSFLCQAFTIWMKAKSQQGMNGSLLFDFSLPSHLPPPQIPPCLLPSQAICIFPVCLVYLLIPEIGTQDFLLQDFSFIFSPEWVVFSRRLL